jgi:hypothetical protein
MRGNVVLPNGDGDDFSQKSFPEPGGNRNSRTEKEMIFCKNHFLNHEEKIIFPEWRRRVTS